jgi:hypothetical protein
VPLFWLKSILIVVSLSFVPALYSVILTNFDPLWGEVLEQFSNAGVFTPTPPHMIILMGIPLILAISTLILRSRNKILHVSFPPVNHELFIVVWFIAGWGLTYIPTDFQIHMINSWQVPVGILASICIFDYIYPLVSRWRITNLTLGKVSLVIILLIIPTNIYLITWRFIDLARHEYPYYLYRNEVEAMEWLEKNAESDSVVISKYEAGQFIPGISGQRSFLAHWAQTVNFFEKREIVEELFNPMTDEERRSEILREYQVDYIFWGPVEQRSKGFDIMDSTYLTKVYQSTYVDIFQVNQESETY